MFNTLLRSTILLSSLLVSLASSAEPFIPESNESVIATWPVQESAGNPNAQTNTLENAISISEDLLARANQPGRSYLYGLAQTTLAPWVKKEIPNASLRINWARIQQQKHNFASALESLEIALNLDPKNVNTHLIMARTYVVLGDFESAKRSCVGLIRSGDLLSASVCNLEVASHQGELEISYQSLKKLALNLQSNDPKLVWVNAVLSEMAIRQGLWQESEAWLEAIYTENDISTLVEWADVKLKLKKYQEVVTKLSAVVERTPSSEDAILIRLALAEQHLNSSLSPSWKQRVAERMALREQRQDLYHANDLAIFYLDIEPNPEKALQWAKVNWQYAREYKDEALLMRALKMSSEPLSQSNR